METFMFSIDFDWIFLEKSVLSVECISFFVNFYMTCTRFYVFVFVICICDCIFYVFVMYLWFLKLLHGFMYEF